MAINFLNNFNFPNTIANNIHNSTVPVNVQINPNPCPDQLVGLLNNGIFTYGTRVDIDYNTANKTVNNPLKLVDPIVIVLESPHTDEFNKNTMAALGPAMGQTGTNFGKYFNSLIVRSKLYNSLLKSQHDVIFVNSIQYQCSLGQNLSGRGSFKNKQLRDKNWNTCFNNKISNDLLDRITAIKPFAVINLCTIGTKNLQLYVDRIINSFNNYTIGNHPSTWIYGIGVIQ